MTDSDERRDWRDHAWLGPIARSLYCGLLKHGISVRKEPRRNHRLLSDAQRVPQRTESLITTMDESTQRVVEGCLSLRAAALIGGFGLLVMAVCAPLAILGLLPQVIVSGDGAATLEQLRTSGTAYLIGAFLLFLTYVMDVVVAWALYWLLRPGQRALSQLVAWMRLVYTALAFIGLMAYFHAYDLANSQDLRELPNTTALQAEIQYQLLAAETTTSVALTFFGVHLLAMSAVIWRSAHIPRWTGIAVALAGAAYVVFYLAKYFQPHLSLDWLMLFALGELVFMGWMLTAGWRLKEPA